jgi:hypothetical protein
MTERRRPVNAQSSRLQDLATLFFEQFKRQGVSLMLHQSDWRFQESYSALLGEYGVKLTILSYNEQDIVPSVVLCPETVVNINRLRNSLAAFSESAHFEQHEKLYELPTKAWVMCGTAAVFQSDIDAGLWSVWYCDRKNRASACLEITHTSLMEDAKALVKR